MMDDYDHRWESLAEIHFSVDDEYADENYIYCLCSRVFLRDGIKLYYVEKEIGSESDVEVITDSKSQIGDAYSHVHFSVDTSNKAKYEKDEGASCYCSASHTDNYCSTDEHDPVQAHSSVYHALQPSDSGADLTYQDNHSDINAPVAIIQNLDKDKLEMDEDLSSDISSEYKENYFSELTWQKFWAVNGERIIWASWIKKYSNYINPAYLDKNNELCMDEYHIPKEHSADPIYPKENEAIRERKFSYDSKVNPYKRKPQQESILQKTIDKPLNDCSSKEYWPLIGRTRSCSEHDRMLSPRTLATTDSMTNVTKMTISSYDITSSHVTSEASDNSVSSSTSDDQSNDQTRLCNIDESLDQMPMEEMDTDQYWQFLWKKHFGEQYALHFANYAENNSAKNKQSQAPVSTENKIETQKISDKSIEFECENSEGNSQEIPSVIEVQTKVDKIKLDDKENNFKKRKGKTSNKYACSVGVLLQNIRKEVSNSDMNEITEAADNTDGKKNSSSTDTVDGSMTQRVHPQNLSQNNSSPTHVGDGGDEPPEDKPVNLKKSHEEDVDDREKIKKALEIMGLCLQSDAMPKGQLVYQKRLSRLRPPRPKRFEAPRKTYFDDDGNPVTIDKESNDEREMQTDDDCPEVKSDDADKETTNMELMATYAMEMKPITFTEISKLDKNITAEALAAPLPPNLDASFSDVADETDEDVFNKADVSTGDSGNIQITDFGKRRRRKRRRSPVTRGSDLPPELVDDPRIKKYWKKRHSLFHRFDEGIKLDMESWFSVTPEKVARHLAERCRCDLIVDAFCGAGGNAIQFAWTCERVIAIDIDPKKIELAQHNATVYGVADRIEFIVGDFFDLAPRLSADVVFLSPPWGGPQYSKNTHYDLETMLLPKPSTELMAAAQNISQNIALYVPRNSRSEQLVSLAKSSGAVEIEQNYLGRRFIALSAYYGELVNY